MKLSKESGHRSSSRMLVAAAVSAGSIVYLGCSSQPNSGAVPEVDELGTEATSAVACTGWTTTCTPDPAPTCLGCAAHPGNVATDSDLLSHIVATPYPAGCTGTPPGTKPAATECCVDMACNSDDESWRAFWVNPYNVVPGYTAPAHTASDGVVLNTGDARLVGKLAHTNKCGPYCAPRVGYPTPDPVTGKKGYAAMPTVDSYHSNESCNGVKGNSDGDCRTACWGIALNKLDPTTHNQVAILGGYKGICNNQMVATVFRGTSSHASVTTFGLGGGLGVSGGLGNAGGMGTSSGIGWNSGTSPSGYLGTGGGFGGWSGLGTTSGLGNTGGFAGYATLGSASGLGIGNGFGDASGMGYDSGFGFNGGLGNNSGIGLCGGFGGGSGFGDGSGLGGGSGFGNGGGFGAGSGLGNTSGLGNASGVGGANF